MFKCSNDEWVSSLDHSSFVIDSSFEFRHSPLPLDLDSPAKRDENNGTGVAPARMGRLT